MTTPTRFALISGGTSLLFAVLATLAFGCDGLHADLDMEPPGAADAGPTDVGTDGDAAGDVSSPDADPSGECDPPCAEDMTCVDGTCVQCVNDDGCPNGDVCYDTECVECADDGDCSVGVCNDDNECVECADNDDCTGECNVCNDDWRCEDDDAECPSVLECDDGQCI